MDFNAVGAVFLGPIIAVTKFMRASTGSLTVTLVLTVSNLLVFIAPKILADVRTEIRSGGMIWEGRVTLI